jgi:hypothetical protein
MASATSVPGYPPPQATQLIQTPMATQVVIDIGSITSVPTQTNVPTLVGPTRFVDLLNQFSLNLPAGWYADPPMGGGSIIYNFDPTILGVGEIVSFPPKSVKIQIGFNELKANQSFQQWLSDVIAFLKSPEAPVPVMVTQPDPYKFGNYEGSSFVVSGYGPSIQNIALPLGDGRVLIIGLMPAESSDIPEVLSVLTTSLAVSPDQFCH